MKQHVYTFFFYHAIIIGVSLTGSQDEWKPHDHPAILQRKITGFTKPVRFLNLAAEFNGRIQQILVNEGDDIPQNENDLYKAIIMDPTFAIIKRDQAISNLKSASIQRQKTVIQLAQVQRNAEYQKNEVVRIRELAESGKVSKIEYDAIKYEFDLSLLKVEELKQEQNLADESVGHHELILNEAEEQLNRHTLTAPSGWIVTQKHVEPGSIVSSGQTLLQLADLSEYAIDLVLSEEEVMALTKMENIRVQFGHHDQSSVLAYIHHIKVDFDPKTRKRLVQLRIPGKKSPIVSGGLEVSITIDVPEKNNSVMIPRTFITSKLEQEFVTTSEGQHIQIIPLRIQNGYVITSKKLIPENSVLTLPRSNVESPK